MENDAKVDEIDLYEAFNILCLFLAQSDEPESTNSALGYPTQQDAFISIGDLFSKASNTVKLTRDAFDRYTSSGRVGWEGSLRAALQQVFDKYGDLPREELLKLSKDIIRMMKENYTSPEARAKIGLFSRIENADSKTRIKPVYFGTIVNFSNTTGNWFAATIDQITSTLNDVLQNLDEFKKAGEHYDEAAWRSVFKTYLSDEVAAALAGTQTLPYFDLLAKIIHYASSDISHNFKYIDLDKDKIEIAVSELKKITTEGAGPETGKGSDHEEERLKGGVNRIFYGAPGTGKSYRVKELTEEAGHEVIKTVFHPDVQNSDFVGALKPVMDGDTITYRFSPGPFAKSLAIAKVNPDKHVSLIIEELNRAPAAAVFGELFLLLDRDANGSGEYDADFPTEEFMAWFQEKTDSFDTKMELPSNLSIYATMNSADQGVYPLDTAFRRRWQQDYIEINYETAPEGNIIIVKEAGVTKTVEWSKFIRVLNEHLSALPYVEEDRLIGPWFVKPSEIEEDVNIPGKLLIYLWDDLLRHEGRDTVFAIDKFSTYGSLSSALDANSPILSQELLAKLDGSADGENADG